MPAVEPTWTAERLALLKSAFEAGLSCREIAADIGVSRNAVIGKLSRLNLTRDEGRSRRRAGKRAAKTDRLNTTPRLQRKCLPRYTANLIRISPTNRSTMRSAAPCTNSARSDAVGRSAAPAPRTFASAATGLSKACPIVRAITAWPIAPGLATASRAVEFDDRLARSLAPKRNLSGEDPSTLHGVGGSVRGRRRSILSTQPQQNDGERHAQGQAIASRGSAARQGDAGSARRQPAHPRSHRTRTARQSECGRGDLFACPARSQSGRRLQRSSDGLRQSRRELFPRAGHRQG